MYDVFQLSALRQRPYSLDGSLFNESADQIFSEAVFTDGKKTIEPLIETIQKIKDELETEVKEQEDSQKSSSSKPKNFNPESFWRHALWKELENQMMDIFGFRTVSINPYIEKYNSKDKVFESRELNACVCSADRFPIDGLVTDKGFYDKTKSVELFVYISLGVIRLLDADEIFAIMLHEFGHGIDPALVTITYTETNILTKYLTDRKRSINKNEKKVIEKEKNHPFLGWLREIFIGKKKAEDERIEKIMKMIQSDPDRFNRKEFAEAYADNFARMYGLGPQLMHGLKKISVDYDKMFNSRVKREKTRQKCILDMTKDLIRDEHKTEIHRIRALMKEYKDDIDDPNTPAPVKKQLQEDLTELEKVLDEYQNNFGDFQNRVNKTINEELMKIEEADAKKKKESSDRKDESKK